MTSLPAAPRPDGPDADLLTREALAVLEAFRAFLANAAFQHSVGLAVLTKIAADESASNRDRLRASEALVSSHIKALQAAAALLGVREVSLQALGIDTGPKAVAAAVAQVNQRIEIVRTSDWREAADVRVLEAEAGPERPAEAEDGGGAAPPPDPGEEQSDG